MQFSRMFCRMLSVDVLVTEQQTLFKALFGGSKQIANQA